MKFLSNIAASLTLVIIVSSAMANEPQVVTLVGDPWPPYIEGELGRKATGGVGTELLHKIFSRIDGVTLETPLIPWNRALSKVEQGAEDGIGILLKTEERERYMVFTDEVLRSVNTIWYSAKRFPAGFEWETFADFEPFLLGVIDGHSYGEEFDLNVASGAVKAVSVSSATQLFAMLAKGRIDIVMCDALVGETFAVALADDGFTIRPTHQAAAIEIYHIGFSRKSSARHLLPDVNRVIHELRNEGFMDKLFDKNSVLKNSKPPLVPKITPSNAPPKTR